MLDAITAQLPLASRNLADRSIAATAGALFGLVVAGTAAIATGRAPFALDPAMVMLYASAIPLSVAGFMMTFAKTKPKLPMLATLWFLALFVPGMFFSELLLSAGFQIGDTYLPPSSFVGFRAIVVAALSGLFFSGIRADGSVGAATQALAPSVDWQKRHDEAVRRLAMVDVELRHDRSREESELDAFDRKLAAALAASDEWTFEIEEEAAVETEGDAVSAMASCHAGA